MSVITFATLYDYIQEAERNSVGFHFPFKNEYTFFHIYDNKVQMNLNVDDYPVAVFLFRPDENTVRLVHVNENYCAMYNEEPQCVLSMSTPISCIHDNPEGWFRYFGDYGEVIKEILRDVLGPYFEKKKVAYQDIQNDLVTKYNELGCLGDSLNKINSSYQRINGTMVSVSSGVEDEIEGICNRMLDIITDIEVMMCSFDIENCNIENFNEIAEALTHQKESVNNNLQEVRKAKDFLARYYSH